MSEVLKRRMRCAVYTRKSSEEGLDQEYNSIDAQRDAGHAYIASQRAEGWIAVADDYDDPAFSGGNMERPALKRLMADIEAGKIDVIVIYKIDRLTRSLADFSKMVEVFERQGVSFVSVTQQFNTTTSMGRLMLNVLLSFAQFEREVTGERIRDKIAASKRKGMWMGGIPPIGYDVANRRLIPNEAEAKTIAHIFQRFVELGSTTKLVKELRLDGVTSKAWTTQDGRVREGKPIDKGLIYKVLNNRTYLGELRHKELWYQAEHPPIITKSIWDDVHAILSTNGRVRATTTRAKTQYLLKGIVFGSDGRAMSPFQTAKQNGRRYRYYVPQRDIKEHAGASGLPRMPAAELESAVLEQLRGHLRSPDVVRDVLPQAQKYDPTLDEAIVTVAMKRLDDVWDQLFPAEQMRIVRLLVRQVNVSPNNMSMDLHPTGIQRLVLELHHKKLQPEPATELAAEAMA
ncbi:recombinase [Limnohabitans sp. MMS-10A-192]|uniref:recombinase family protein n=1 Tax=Limnohabitans sp. MMS-10A-192 TaxID=1835769 RepID=UPI000D3A55EC|nr:recombinase family protein [Limnohabitans sp. MMS-10A-192]PUE18581.1 recombinase [Limnohabitans sp. MMS-10A-192]